MLIIKPHKKDNPKDDHYIDRLLKTFKYKVKQTKLIENLRDKQFYTKPSLRKRNNKIKSIKVSIYRREHEN